MKPQDIGPQFEDEFSERHGLRRVPGSGNQWHSKLDANARGARWSLKATAAGSYRIDRNDIEELLAAGAPGQDDDMRFMAIKVSAGADHPIVLVVSLEDNFAELATGELELFQETRSDVKRRFAATPELLREE